MDLSCHVWTCLVTRRVHPRITLMKYYSTRVTLMKYYSRMYVAYGFVVSRMNVSCDKACSPAHYSNEVLLYACYSNEVLLWCMWRMDLSCHVWTRLVKRRVLPRMTLMKCYSARITPIEHYSNEVLLYAYYSNEVLLWWSITLMKYYSNEVLL